ncbi:HAAS signaling domain-containing protein [uncultured Gemella sp.]|uniref:DUF1700 domain-containing protein n=1 Tax=uncultured Gemella sp. TaxID=254352 RepID=UPI0028D7D6E3|nr:DUF1700 domain-containing protein [uncultured Gemella sp.]
MDKTQFCTLLGNKLKQYLSPKEMYKTLNFFEEMIDDRIDEGLSEEEAVSQLGDINIIVDQILDEHNIGKKQTKLVWRFIPRELGFINIVLLFPAWITIFSLVASLFIVILSIIFSIVFSIIAIFIGGILLILKSPFYLIYERNISYFLDTLGFGFVISGAGLIGIDWLIKIYKKSRQNGINIRTIFVKIFKKEVYINE